EDEADDRGGNDRQEGGQGAKQGVGVLGQVVADGVEDEVGGEGAGDEELAVGEVGDVHHAEDEGEAHGEQRPHTAGDDGVDENEGAAVPGGVDSGGDAEDNGDAGGRKQPAAQAGRGALLHTFFDSQFGHGVNSSDTQESFAHVVVLQQLAARPLEHDVALLQHVCAVGDTQGGVHVLVDEQ